MYVLHIHVKGKYTFSQVFKLFFSKRNIFKNCCFAEKTRIYGVLNDFPKLNERGKAPQNSFKINMLQKMYDHLTQGVAQASCRNEILSRMLLKY